MAIVSHQGRGIKPWQVHPKIGSPASRLDLAAAAFHLEQHHALATVLGRIQRWTANDGDEPAPRPSVPALLQEHAAVHSRELFCDSSALLRKALAVSQRQREPDIHNHSQADDFGRGLK